MRQGTESSPNSISTWFRLGKQLTYNLCGPVLRHNHLAAPLNQSAPSPRACREGPGDTKLAIARLLHDPVTRVSRASANL